MKFKHNDRLIGDISTAGYDTEKSQYANLLYLKPKGDVSFQKNNT